MVELARKLAGLRQQAGVSARVTAKATSLAPLDDSKVVQLRALLKLRSTPMHLSALAADRYLPGDEIAPGLRYLERTYPEVVPDTLALHELAHPLVRSRDLLAFDTETTGLAGGTGTRAFMIGVGDWKTGILRVRQLFITALSAEQAMLCMFLSWIEDDTILVSYNGKCYDRPLLSTRLRLARLEDPLLGRTHIDLLHPVRRRYRGVWPNCRLATAERELLGVCREDDLPGSEAPAAWLSFLRGGSAANLRRVLVHNETDIRSLVGLLRKFESDVSSPA